VTLILETGVSANPKYFDIAVSGNYNTCRSNKVVFPATAGTGQDLAWSSSEHENIFQRGSEYINKDD